MNNSSHNSNEASKTSPSVSFSTYPGQFHAQSATFQNEHPTSVDPIAENPKMMAQQFLSAPSPSQISDTFSSELALAPSETYSNNSPPTKVVATNCVASSMVSSNSNDNILMSSSSSSIPDISSIVQDEQAMVFTSNTSPLFSSSIDAINHSNNLLQPMNQVINVDHDAMISSQMNNVNSDDNISDVSSSMASKPSLSLHDDSVMTIIHDQDQFDVSQMNDNDNDRAARISLDNLQRALHEHHLERLATSSTDLSSLHVPCPIFLARFESDITQILAARHLPLALPILIICVTYLLRHGTQSCDFTAIQNCMQRYDATSHDYEPFAYFHPEMPYTRNLIATDKQHWTMLLLCFNPEAKTPVHDHQSECFVRVVQGSVIENRFRWPCLDTQHLPCSGHGKTLHNNGIHIPQSQQLECFSTAPAHAGDVTFMNDSIGLHCLQNPSTTQPTMTLHLYIPPYTACNVFCMDNGIRVYSCPMRFHSVEGTSCLENTVTLAQYDPKLCQQHNNKK